MLAIPSYFYPVLWELSHSKIRALRPGTFKSMNEFPPPLAAALLIELGIENLIKGPPKRAVLLMEGDYFSEFFMK